jgi:hypothetical protein
MHGSRVASWIRNRLTGRSGLSLDQEARRPEIGVSSIPQEPRRARVLALGIYLGHRPNTANDVAIRLEESISANVTQNWTAIDRLSSSWTLRRRTGALWRGLSPKYELIGHALSQYDLTDFDYLVLIDDDILLPYGFLDAFLYVQRRLDFSIAQPARTSESYIDLPIVERHPGLLARSTLFVEQGPVICFRSDCFEFLLPFDLTSPMGWGFENVWSIEVTDRGLRMGIIDATPVDHSLRPPTAYYDWGQADRARAQLFATRRHRSNDECFRVLEAVPLRP